VVACATVNRERIPAGTDPLPPPSASEMETLHGSMREMANRVQKIDAMLRGVEPKTPEERRDVVRLLHEVEVIANQLSAENVRSVHPKIAHNIDAFRDDIQRARIYAEADPPNYYLAGTLAGACANCHGPGFGKIK
jgi:hypothetical protein